MRWSDIDFQPTTRTLRQFAALAAAFLAGMAAWQGLARGREAIALTLMALAAVAALCGLARPALVRWLFLGCLVATFPIGWLMSWLLLGCLYFLIITPAACCSRLIGRDVLGRRFDPHLDTYWTEKPHPRDVRRYFRQF